MTDVMWTMLAIALVSAAMLAVTNRQKSSFTGVDYTRGTLSALRGPAFPGLRISLGPYLVDKTAVIEKIVKTGFYQRVDLVLRPRRCGKSCMLHMLRSFFSMRESNHRDLFKGLYIASRPDICEAHMGKYAVIFLDFMSLRAGTWDAMLLLFRAQLSRLYTDWEGYRGSLSPKEMDDFQSIVLEDASFDHCKLALKQLSFLLARKSRRGVIVLIDEYEGPVSCASEHGYFPQANEYFGCGVFSSLLKGNDSLSIGILVGVTPPAKSGRYSGVAMHPLHRFNSIYAGMLMFTEGEVQHLLELSRSRLELSDLRAHYNCYFAANRVRVYNPVSIMSALEEGVIRNYWVATGQHPLIRRNVEHLDAETLEIFAKLLSQSEIEMDLAEDIYFNVADLKGRGIVTLLYYAGYLTMTIPNAEVLCDWSAWITGGNSTLEPENIFMTCANGPVSAFVTLWPTFMQATLDPTLVAKEPRVKSKKTPERLYQVYVLGVLHGLRSHGWEVHVELHAGSGYTDICLISRKRRATALIELKSSKSGQQLERDADRALEQIVTKNYRNRYSLSGVDCIREYGMANFHLESIVKGRYLAWLGNSWQEMDDPAQTA